MTQCVLLSDLRDKFCLLIFYSALMQLIGRSNMSLNLFVRWSLLLVLLQPELDLVLVTDL